MARGKRVALALPSEIYDVLKAISVKTNTPMTAIITELLKDTLPTFEQVLKAIDEAKRGQERLALETTRKFLESATSVLDQAKLDFNDMEGRHGKPK